MLHTLKMESYLTVDREGKVGNVFEGHPCFSPQGVKIIRKELAPLNCPNRAQ